MNGKDEQNADRQLNNAEREDYQFLKETYKKRPADPKAVCRIVLGVLVLAAVAGAVGGLVFKAVISKTAREAAHITFSSDDAVVASENESASDSASEAESASSSVKSDAAEAPSGTEEQQALSSYAALSRHLNRIGRAASASLVQVTGVTKSEDWLKNADQNAVTQSGLVVADNGSAFLILVDYTHLMGLKQTVVALPDGTIAGASVIKTDPVTKLSVLSVPYGGLSRTVRQSVKTASLGNSYALSDGDTVIAIGSPLGYSNAVIYGTVTSMDTQVPVTDSAFDLLVTDMRGSSSGNGFLLNTDGEIVGMILQKYATRNASVVTAVPISMLKSLIETLTNNQPISYLGIHGETVPAAAQKASGIPAGIYITSVDQNSPALKAGISQGDILERFDGVEVGSMTEVRSRLEGLKAGDEVKVTVMRPGSKGYVQFHFEVTVGEI